MMNKTAAYHEWLGIPMRDEGPNHYEILGIPLFETNVTVISNGASRRVSFLQTMVAGDFSELAQEIQKEVSRAKLCLIKETSRQIYQDALTRQLQQDNLADQMDKIESTFSVADEMGASMEVFIDETRQQNLKLAKQKIWLIGSSPDCDLVIKNHFVSRKHCLLFAKEKEFELEDWASTNGTFVNDKMIMPRVRTKIKQKDIVTLGKCTLMPWPPIGQ